jgi:hypothetical protein
MTSRKTLPKIRTGSILQLYVKPSAFLIGQSRVFRAQVGRSPTIDKPELLEEHMALSFISYKLRARVQGGSPVVTPLQAGVTIRLYPVQLLFFSCFFVCFSSPSLISTQPSQWAGKSKPRRSSAIPRPS